MHTKQLGPHLPKAQALKLEPGTWIQVQFKNGPNQVAMVTQTPEFEKGDMSVAVYFPREQKRYQYWHVMHTQIVRVIQRPQVPEAQ